MLPLIGEKKIERKKAESLESDGYPLKREKFLYQEDSTFWEVCDSPFPKRRIQRLKPYTGEVDVILPPVVSEIRVENFFRDLLHEKRFFSSCTVLYIKLVYKEMILFFSLATLDLENNWISSLPVQLIECNQLVWLNLRFNRIKQVRFSALLRIFFSNFREPLMKVS